MSELTLEKVRRKRYRCQECGHEIEQDTNHYGHTYSWGSYNTCPTCPPYKRPNTWVCCEEPPAGMGKPENWRKVEIEIKVVKPKRKAKR